VLCWALTHLARAKDPLLPWLAQDMAEIEAVSELPGCNTATIMKVPPEDPLSRLLHDLQRHIPSVNAHQHRSTAQLSSLDREPRLRAETFWLNFHS